MNLSTRQILISVSVLLVLVLGGYYFLFLTIKSKNEKVSSFSQEIDLYSEREALRRTTEKTADELSEKIKKLDSYFIHKDEVVPFIENIENAGGESGVSVSIVSVGVDALSQVGGGSSDNIPLDKSEKLILRLDAKGSWGNVVNFISYLENLPYKISINRVALHKNSSVQPFFSAGEAPIKKSDNPTADWSSTIEMSVLTLK